jgi:uncharacterized protein YdhG (YjbR/CyaY superfamily)
VSVEFETVAEYIASFPPDVQEGLNDLRRLIYDVAPSVEEKISYKIPTYFLDGRTFVFFAGWKTHISLHAIPKLEEPLEREVAPYRSGKDTVRFPLGEPVPDELVTRILTSMRDARTGAGG